MNTKVLLLVGGIVMVGLLVVALVITTNKLCQTNNNTGNALSSDKVISEMRDRINALELENRRLAQKTSSLEQELVSARNRFASSQKELMEIKESTPVTPTMHPSAEQFIKGLESGQSMDMKVVKIRECGKRFARLARAARSTEHSKGPNPAEIAQLGELMQIMAELQPDTLEEMFTNDLSMLGLGKADMRQFFTNITAGILEELGTPFNQDQITQYESTLAKLAEVDKKFIRDDQTPAEKMITRLQNIDAINTVLDEIPNIFSSEQRTLLKDENLQLPWDLFMTEARPSVPSQVQTFKEQDKAVDYLIAKLSDDSITPEQEPVIKSTTEQYLKDYTALRKRMEPLYDKNIIDAYFERNKPADKKNEGEYRYRIEKAELFRKNPEYIKAKTALDIEFLQLQNKYQKEITGITKTDSEKSPIAGFIFIDHFPNLD